MNTTGIGFFSQFMPHGQCYAWLPSLLWSNILVDLLVASAYFSIAITVWLYSKNKTGFSHWKASYLIIFFITLWGFTHLVDIFTIWYGFYGIQTFFKIITCIVSIVTALYLMKILPQVLQLPSQTDYAQAPNSAAHELSQREELEEKAIEFEHTQHQIKRLDRVLNTIHEGIWEWQVGTNHVWYSPRMYQMIKTNDIEIDESKQHIDWFNHIHPNDQERVSKALQDHIHFNKPYDVEYLGLSSDDKYRWIHASGKLVPQEDGQPQYMAGVMTDIHTSKIAELEHQVMIENYRTIFDHVAVGIAKTNEKGTIIEANNTLADLLHMDLAQLNKLPINSLIHADDLEIDKQQLAQLREGKLHHYTVEKRVSSPYSRCYQWMLLTVTQHQSAINDAVHRLVVFQDISEQKQAEQLLESSNQALEQFAYAASHDLQEPLRKMGSFAQRLEQRLMTNHDLDDASKFELGRITDAAARMSRMITSLLNLARINTQNLHLEKTSISAILNDVKETLSMQIAESGAAIKLISDLEITADKQLLHHLLQNLVSNSIHYAQDGRSPIISVECVINKDQTGVVYFKDNGMGLDMDYAESIFAPFKRLSAQNPKGQGMGLSICKQIIKAHGGTIRVVSSSNEGTLFEISLPQDMIQV